MSLRRSRERRNAGGPPAGVAAARAATLLARAMSVKCSRHAAASRTQAGRLRTGRRAAGVPSEHFLHHLEEEVTLGENARTTDDLQV
jgi:hypothetical protein